MSKPTHLISYNLHNHPHAVEIEAESAELTLDQARLRLNSIHTFEWPNEITDVQVTPIAQQDRTTVSRHAQG
ncbi:hypothetical protein [Pseudomonas sp. EA_35y_Pfl2_R111]|uniref:hypothetical protein n=1 Tax=Pseudomonas sp. EA_35y_Pfl2_R111 TaxID=3088689 RepID=UPI0030D6FBF9